MRGGWLSAVVVPRSGALDPTPGSPPRSWARRAGRGRTPDWTGTRRPGPVLAQTMVGTIARNHAADIGAESRRRSLGPQAMGRGPGGGVAADGCVAPTDRGAQSPHRSGGSRRGWAAALAGDDAVE